MKENKLLWGLVFFNTVGTVVMAILIALLLIAAVMTPNGGDETRKYIDEQMTINQKYIEKVVAEDQKYINQETQKLYNYVNSR